MLLHEAGRHVEVGEVNGEGWTHVTENKITIEDFSTEQVKLGSVVRGAKQLFKRVVDQWKSVHLNCADPLLFENIDTIENCARKTGVAAYKLEGYTFSTANSVFNTTRFGSYADAFTICSFEATCSGFSQIAIDHFVLHSGAADVVSQVITSFEMSPKTEQFDGFLLEGLTGVESTTYATYNEAFNACRREIACSGFTKSSNGYFTLRTGKTLITATATETTYLLTQDRFGFMYKPTTKDCVVQSCQHGIYETVVGSSGWISYVATGFYPESYKNYDLIPFNKKGKLTCMDGDESGVRYTGTTSAEACLSYNGEDYVGEIVSYQVSTGNCELLSCENNNYKWTNTEETDFYVFAKNTVDAK
eukprot:Awhi_evm1s1946